MKTTDVKEKSVFVKLSDYKEIVDLINNLHTKLGQADNTLKRIMETKAEEDKELELWKNTINEVHSKVNYIETTMFEPER